MWKSGFLLRAAILFFPQGDVGIFTGIHRVCGKKICAGFVHRKSFHNPQPLWINFGLQKVYVTFLCQTRKEQRISYRQELILAVISRMAFCRAGSPVFIAASTFFTACMTVVWSRSNSLPISGKERLVS